MTTRLPGTSSINDKIRVKTMSLINDLIINSASITDPNNRDNHNNLISITYSATTLSQITSTNTYRARSSLRTITTLQITKLHTRQQLVSRSSRQMPTTRLQLTKNGGCSLLDALRRLCSLLAVLGEQDTLSAMGSHSA
jgi:hypothetical protein